MVSETSEINLPDTFVCPADMPDDQCGALNDLVVVSGTTGEVICTVCSAVLGIKEEEEDGEFAISEEGETDDESEGADDEQGASESGLSDITTEWDAEKRKEEGAKVALRNLTDMLIESSVQEAQELGILVQQEYYGIFANTPVLSGQGILSPTNIQKGNGPNISPYPSSQGKEIPHQQQSNSWRSGRPKQNQSTGQGRYPLSIRRRKTDQS